MTQDIFVRVLFKKRSLRSTTLRLFEFVLSQK